VPVVGATVGPVDELTRLLGEAQAGDSRSLEAFVRLTQPSVWRFCAHLLGPDDATDATQETYLAAWRAMPAFRGDASARTWLFAIARRTAERVARGRRRWVELADHALGPPPSAHPEQAAELGDLLAGLDLDRRLALVLTQIVGLSYAEAAAVCDCPVGTIRSRVARGRKDLIERLEARPEASGLGDT